MVNLLSNDGCYEHTYIDHTKTDYLDIRTLQLHNFAWIITGACMVVACILSFYLMYKHLKNYSRPNYQKHIVRILLMVPIYSIDSFLSFRFYWDAVYFDVLRDCYEAFVIYTFYRLLIEYLGGYEQAKEVFSDREPFKLIVPLCCVQVNPRRGLLRQCKRLTLQYVVIRPILTLVIIILQSYNSYCPGNYSVNHGYLYITIILFASVSVAMYALVMFYTVCRKDIAKFNPIPKFLSVKLIIFMSFWQSIMVSGLVTIHVIKASGTYWSTDNIATGVQNALLCVEMLIAAIFHLKAFAWQEFAVTDLPTSVIKSIRNVFNPKDIVIDVFHSFFPPQIRQKPIIAPDGKSKEGKVSVEMNSIISSPSVNSSINNSSEDKLSPNSNSLPFVPSGETAYV